MSNVFAEEKSLKEDLRAGRVPLGSILYIQWPSGAKEAVRFHNWTSNRNAYKTNYISGCNMGWDNGATEWYDIDIAFLERVERPKQKKCESCKELVYMWHGHAMWCKPEKPYPQYQSLESAQSQSTKQERR